MGLRLSPQDVPAGHADWQVQTKRGCSPHFPCNIYTRRSNFSVHCAMIIVFGLFTAKTLVLEALDTQQKKE